MANNYQIRSVPRMFEEVIRQIITYIHDEKLEKGAKLPPERKLSELLAVSRSSVREGLRILELLKYLESRQGGGTFVSDPPPFLIPSRIIRQTLENETLENYFDIALMNAEKIILLTLDKEVSISLTRSENHGFWTEFSKWVNELGMHLENDYYLHLWNNIHHLLTENRYLENLTISTTIDDLKIAFYKKDKVTLTAFFNSFSG
ncbi:FadR/GntR family transcriptional regulator [Bacillus sp. Marseille-Q3570]|uniref:FadR/GntR family transcriptional regulator n=1 Tax=Bacillus sp. Marseille-Q3570 TaxID=2963522 RepID=UPI0021B6FE49|nr:GntR family transcriptional regulator [Bacillus sp. Marseille-Q3570]